MKYIILILITCLLSFVFVIDNLQANNIKEQYIPKQTIPMKITKFEVIKLQQPDLKGGDVLMSAFKNRKSDREFSSKNLSLKHLSEILWAAYGINREDGKRTVPSALALYPLKIYAILENGIYLYSSEKHELIPVIEGNYKEYAGLQPFVKDAPLNLLFFADFNKYKIGDKIKNEMLETDKIRIASLDVGHCTQNVYLYCASEGLKTVVRAAVNAKALGEILKLDVNMQFIVAQTIGY